VEFHSAEDPDSLRGPTASWVWMDEAAMCPAETFDIVMPTLLATDGFFLGTTTPRGVENWTYRKIYKRSIAPGLKDHDPDQYDPSYGVVVGSTWENKENLSERAVQLLTDQYGGEDTFFGRQEIRGEFVSFEGRVYQWDAMTDYVPLDKLPPIEECSVVCGGLDFGWSPDPTAAYVLGYKDGTWYVYDELYETELLKDALGAELMALTLRYKVPIWWADSANPDDIQELRVMGLPVRPVVKPKIMTRIREMAAFANSGRMKVSYRCPNARNEFQVYQWAANASYRPGPEKKPVDRDNHAMDALGYAVWMNRHLWSGQLRVHDEDAPVDREKRLQEFYDKLTGKDEATTAPGFSGLYNR
jgi:phage terminase large subunit